MDPKPRDIRKRAGWSQDRAAVMAGVSAPTVRLYEANRDAVTPEKRAPLDRIYAQLASETPNHAA
jgi:transcriptional regulator with XRE-family HTH domain